MSNRQIATVLSVGRSTINRDMSGPNGPVSGPNGPDCAAFAADCAVFAAEGAAFAALKSKPEDIELARFWVSVT